MNFFPFERQRFERVREAFMMWSESLLKSTRRNEEKSNQELNLITFRVCEKWWERMTFWRAPGRGSRWASDDVLIEIQGADTSWKIWGSEKIFNDAVASLSARHVLEGFSSILSFAQRAFISFPELHALNLDDDWCDQSETSAWCYRWFGVWDAECNDW